MERAAADRVLQPAAHGDYFFLRQSMYDSGGAPGPLIPRPEFSAVVAAADAKDEPGGGQQHSEIIPRAYSFDLRSREGELEQPRHAIRRLLEAGPAKAAPLLCQNVALVVSGLQVLDGVTWLQLDTDSRRLAHFHPVSEAQLPALVVPKAVGIVRLVDADGVVGSSLAELEPVDFPEVVQIIWLVQFRFAGILAWVVAELPEVIEAPAVELALVACHDRVTVSERDLSQVDALIEKFILNLHQVLPPAAVVHVLQIAENLQVQHHRKCTALQLIHDHQLSLGMSSFVGLAQAPFVYQAGALTCFLAVLLRDEHGAYSRFQI